MQTKTMMMKIIGLVAKHALVVIVALCLLLFSSALGGFFSSDDWFIFRVAQINNIKEFVNFFSFVHTEQYTGAYRPLSTSIFFWLFYQLFHLNPFPYFVFGLTLFGLTLTSLYKLLMGLNLNRTVSLLAVLLYGVSATNVTKLNFIGAYNEYFLALFVLLALRLAVTNNYLYLIFYILALLSKETAIIFPILVILTDWFTNKKPIKRIKLYLPISIITVAYLYLRLVVFKNTEGDSYILDFSLKKTANTLMWYIFWSLGAPEFLVDYVGSGLKVVPKFFVEFPIYAKPILFQLGLVSVLFTVTTASSLSRIKTVIRPYLFGVGFFIVALLPVLFFPWHKFTHLLTLPMVGITVVMATAINSKKIIGTMFVIAYLLINLTTISLLNTRHYSVTRGQLAHRVYAYFTANYPKYPAMQPFYFINDSPVTVQQWGVSKQISQALSGSEFFKVFYEDKNIKVYFDDLDTNIPPNAIQIGSSQFLR